MPTFSRIWARNIYPFLSIHPKEQGHRCSRQLPLIRARSRTCGEHALTSHPFYNTLLPDLEFFRPFSSNAKGNSYATSLNIFASCHIVRLIVSSTHSVCGASEARESRAICIGQTYSWRLRCLCESGAQGVESARRRRGRSAGRQDYPPKRVRLSRPRETTAGHTQHTV